MNKNIKKNILRFLVIYLIFTGLTYFSNTVLATFDVSSVRFSAALNPVLGIAFGWPAILGCAAGNLTCDLLSYGFKVALMGLLPQIFYGAFPYYVWKKAARRDSHSTRLDSPSKVLGFALLMAVNAFLMGLAVGVIQYITSQSDFWSILFFVFADDFEVSLIFGLPFMTLLDFYHSNLKAERKRSLSVNEIIILCSGALQLAGFIGIAVFCGIIGRGLSVREIWKDIFHNTGYAVNIVLILSVSVMYLFSYLKKKNSGLRIIEKHDGTVFADEKKRLEFLSFPGRDPSSEAQNNLQTPSYETCWYAALSNQKGCQMKCAFCDCPGFGFYGNASLDELQYQLETILDNCGTSHTRRFEIDLARMGEPTFNPDVLTFTEFSLRETVLKKVDADVIYPVLSTMLPRTQKNLVHFLSEYCRIKNEVYNGSADLQLSIQSTDEAVRKHDFRNMALSLPEIAAICRDLPAPKGRKYILSFAVTRDTVIDAALIDSLFDKNKFLIKLMPIHSTYNAIYNGLVSDYAADLLDAPKKQFEALGWDVMLCVEKKEADDDALTCGNLLLSNIPDKISSKVSKKKKIGILVAIELSAVFKMYGNPKVLDSPDGFKILQVEKENYTVYILQCGMGEVAASAGTQYLISRFRVSMIVNFGVVGGLTADMGKQKVCLVNRVVHYKYDCSEFMNLAVGQVDGHDSIFLRFGENLIKNAQSAAEEPLPLVTCCSGDKFIGTAEEKEYLHRTFDGDICDMESAGVVLTCEANRVPCILFKAVSDGLNDGADGFFAELDAASLKCLQVADKIMEKIARMES